MSDQSSAVALSIDSILGSLSSESALKSMIVGQLDAHFPMLGTLSNYADQPISKAAGAKASASFNPTKACSWKTANGIVFSFSPSARCTIAVSSSSETFDVAMNIESMSSTEKVSATAPSGSVYINIELDFAIQGNVSVTAPLGTIGISGKASGSQAASLSFSLPIAGTLSTPDAIKEAFEKFVFPLDPACLGRLRTGTLLKVAFDANLSCDLDVKYGLGNYKVAAPDLSSVQASMKNLVGFKPPSTSVDVGVKGSFRYVHSGDFSLIINRSGEATAKVYLTRSSEQDADATLGVSAQVTTCVPALKVDPTALQTVAQDITKNAAVAKQVVCAASGSTNDLITGLDGKLSNWAKDATGTVGLTAGLSRQKGHVALFVYDVDLSQPTASEGWKQLIDGTPSRALLHPGFTLDQGSGISDSLTRAATLKFQFFNLFAFNTTEEYFKNSFTEIGKDGSIQIVHEIGKEHDSDANKRQRKIRFYFEATATKSPSSVSISNAQVDLCMELSETGNSPYGATLANVIGFLPSTASTNDAQERMIAYVHSKPAGTLDLKFTLKQSAYRRISASPFKGQTPPPLPQEQDAANWEAFQSATRTLVRSAPFVESLTFNVWQTFNVASIDRFGSKSTPDRSYTGDPANVPSSYLSRFGDPGLVGYFLGASQCFMNLCDDLRLLAGGLPKVQNSQQWKDLLATLQRVVSDDDYLDYGLPMCAALLLQCSKNGVQVSTSLAPSADGESFTCLVAVA